MNELTKQIVENKESNIILQVNSQDLKEIITEIVSSTLKEDTDDEYLTTEEVCRMVKVEKNSLTRYAKQQIITPIRAFGKNLYSKKEILRVMEEGKL